MRLKESLRNYSAEVAVKRLHGHTRIELTDTKTGEVEIFEKDNLITDLVQNIFNHDIWGGLDYSKVVPLTQLFNGCLLYNTDLPEVDSSITSIPKGATLTAHAGSTAYVGPDTTAGNLNVPESGEILRGGLKAGYKWVFDWGTSQGNGEINCVSLCPSAIGLRGRNSESFADKPYLPLGQFISTGSTAILRDSQLIEYETNRLYSVDYTATSVTVKAYIMPMKSYGLLDNMGDLELLYTKTFAVNAPRYLVSSAQLVGNIIYISAYSSSTTISLIKVDKNTGELISDEQLTYSGVNFDRFGLYNDSSSYTIQSAFPIVDGYIYFPKNDRRTYYKCSLTNLADVTELPTEITAQFSSQGRGGSVILSNENIIFNDHAIINDRVIKIQNSSPTGEVAFFGGEELEASGVYTTRIKSSHSKNMFNEVYLSVLMDSISTINLLDVPVSKTPDKTMKLEYSITMEE